MRYEIETYEPDRSGWVPFATALTRRACIEIIRMLERWGYDRQVSIFVRRRG